MGTSIIGGHGRGIWTLLVLLAVAFCVGWIAHSLTVWAPESDAARPLENGALPDDRRPPSRTGDDAVLRGNPVEPTPPSGAESAAAAPPESEALPSVASSPAVRFLEVPGGGEAGSLHVRVQDPQGDAAGGMTVGILCHGGKPTSRELATDASGLAAFEGLDENVWRVECSFPGGRLVSAAEVFAGYVTEVSLVLPIRGSTFEGIVTDVIKGPIEGETVTLTSVGGWSRATLTTHTDSRGWYRFEGVPPGAWSIHLASWRSDSGFSRSTSDLVAPGRTTRRDFSIGPRLRGTVRDLRTRDPVAGVRVQCTERGRMLDSTTTDADGAYAFRTQLPSTVGLMMSKSGYGFTALRDIAVPEEGAVVDVDLAEAARLRVHVTDPQGGPVAGSLYVGVDPKVAGQGTDVGTNIFLDAEGRGSYDEILPGAYTLHFSANDVGSTRLEMTLFPGENSLEVQLQPK